MKYYHIIENTTDQQVLEIVAPDLETAIKIYLEHSAYDPIIDQDTIEEQSCYEFPSEYCYIIRQNEFIAFAEWVSKKGLY